MADDLIKKEHAAFCQFIQTLREYGNLIMETEPHFRTLLNVALKLDPNDKSGDSIHNFCQALADILEAVRESTKAEVIGFQDDKPRSGKIDGSGKAIGDLYEGIEENSESETD